MRVIFAGGGTGGHLYPAIAIAEVLQAKGVEFHFFVSDRGIEARILKRLGYSFTEQKVSAFMGKSLLHKIKAVVYLAVGCVKVFPKIKKGDKVILTGGFAAAPCAVVAKLKGAELYLHEQNSVMGFTNRIFAKLSKKVFLSFEKTLNASGKEVVTGNPVRKIFSRVGAKEDFTGDILVMGGSQGSRVVNKLIVEAIDLLIKEGFKVTHQTGEGLYGETVRDYGHMMNKYIKELEVMPYIDGVAAKMREADVVIGRSGSGIVFELMAVNCPALYIPFGHASHNHQYFNALAAENMGLALVLEESEATPEVLVEKLRYIKENYKKYKNNFKKYPPIDSAELIVREVGIE